MVEYIVLIKFKHKGELIKNNEVIVKDINIMVNKINQEDYICLTDIAKKKNSKDPNQVIEN